MIGLGGSHDSDKLRDELKRSRQKALELAKLNMAKLLPHFRIGMYERQELEEFERLWIIFASCLDVLYTQMYKTVSLQQIFPIHAGLATVFINTGLTEPLLGHKSCVLSVEPLDASSVDRMRAEREEVCLLESELREIGNMISEMDQRVDIKPWAMQPELGSSKLECASSLNSASEASTAVVEEAVSVYSQERQRRKKCMFLVVIVILSMAVFGTVLGICITVLT